MLTMLVSNISDTRYGSNVSNNVSNISDSDTRYGSNVNNVILAILGNVS